MIFSVRGGFDWPESLPSMYLMISDAGSALPSTPDSKATRANVRPGFASTHSSAASLVATDWVKAGSTFPHADLKHAGSCKHASEHSASNVSLDDLYPILEIVVRSLVGSVRPFKSAGS